MLSVSLRAKTNEAPAVMASASYEPSKECLCKSRPSAIEPEASHLRKPPQDCAVRRGREVVHATNLDA